MIAIEGTDEMTAEGSGRGIPVVGPDTEGVRVEFATTIRGEEVTCWVEDGYLRGDAALLERLSRFAAPGEPLGPIAVVHLLRDAVGSDVSIRFTVDRS